MECRQNDDADATFIAHARTDIPALVAEVTRLRTALEHAPTFADGVRAMKATALAAVSTCCESAYADIERIDPSTVKP